MMEIEKILKDLVGFKTTHQPENKKEFDKAVDYLISKLKNLNVKISLKKKNGYWNLIIQKDKAKNPKITMLVHLDVVPAEEKMFIFKEQKGKFYGRGVNDMKFAIAVGLRFLEETKNQKLSFGMIITSDEEIGGENGTKYVIEDLKYRSDVFVIPDGGNNLGIEILGKGVLHLKISQKGKSAHGSQPWLGKNALDDLIKKYQKLRKIFPIVKKETWKTTVNLGKLSGGETANQVCDYAEIYLDFRYPPSLNKEKILGQVKKIFKTSKIEIIAEGEPVKIDPKNNFVRQWREITKEITKKEPKFTRAYGATDARYLVPYKVPLIISKPKGGGEHSEKEWLDKKSLYHFYEIFKKFTIQVAKC